MTKKCVGRVSGCGRRAFGAPAEPLLPWREPYILARVVPSWASSMGPTSSIPHGKSMLGENCSLWLELSAAGVEGGAGFLAEGSPPSPSELENMVLGMFVRTLSDVCSGSCEGHRTCNRHHIDSNSVSFVTVSRVFQEGYIPLPGVNLALVGCNAGSCTLVGLFTWAQRAGELCLVLGRRMRLASFLGGLRAKWFDLCRFPLSTCTDDTRPPSN